MALKNFDGAVAVITGGASGIGLATARALYSEGAHVILADINEPALQQAALLVKESKPSSMGQVVTLKTDVSNEEQVQELMRHALDTCGRIDLVVTSAGIGRGDVIDRFTGNEMQSMMNINFMGTYHCVRAALPMMRQQQSGYFVLLSSVAGKLAVPILTGYCASKWAVRGFSSALRAELYGTGIGVTTVYPSWVDTPMTQQEGLRLLNIEAKLTAEQVAGEILQAILQERHDLTLAPDAGTALLLQITENDPEKAEEVMGRSFQQRSQEFFGTQP